MNNIVYVSTGILVNKKKQILMEKHIKHNFFKGLYQFPGGKIEQNETPIQALIREFKEELNISLNPEDCMPFSFTEYQDEEGQTYLVLFYICTNWEGDINPLEDQEILWVNVETMEIIPTLPYNKETVKKLYVFI